MALGHSPQIVTQGLVFYIDPSSTKSYAGFGNTIYNMVNSSIGGTFFNFSANPIDNTGNRSIYLNGSTNAVLIPSSNLQFGTSDFTIQFWFKIQNFTDGKTIFSDGWGATNGGFLFYTYKVGSDERILYYSTNSNGNWDIAQAKDIILAPSYNTWYNVAVSRIGNTFTLYSNGQSVNTFSSSLSLRNTGYPYSLGASPIAGNACTCSIGSVLIYKNKGLTATEILQNYNSTRKKYYPEERIVTDGLILNYDFSKRNSYPGTGFVLTDISTSGNTGTLNNSPTYTTSNGGGMIFNGSNQNISVVSLPPLTNQITISVWIKPQDNSGLGWIIGREGAYRMFYSSNSIIFDCATVNNSWYSTGTNLVASGYSIYNSWWHCVGTYDGSNNRLYINGQLVVTGASISGNITNGNALSIIQTGTAGIVYGKGTIGEIKIYNRALSQQEVLQNFNATKNRFLNALPPVRNNLILEYDATDVNSYPGTGTSWFDTSGFSNHGILTNGPVLSATGTSSSIAFDGTNDFVNIFYPAQLYPGSPITLSLWAKWTTTGTTTSTIQTLVDNNYQTSPGSIGFFIQDRPDLSGVLEWGAQPGAGITRCTSTFVVGDGKWHHITATNDGATSILYVDGVQSGLARTAAGIGSSQPFINLGRWRFTQSRYLNGNIADFRIYNRALSAVEVKQNFDYYRTRYGI